MEWINAKEKLPHGPIPVLCYRNRNMWVGIYSNGKDVECVDSSEDSILLDAGWFELEEQHDSQFDEFYCSREVDFWMLLPNKPIDTKLNLG